ncbi:MAG: hypothetical protein ACYC0Q_02370 [Eubacteriales bacterium]
MEIGKSIRFSNNLLRWLILLAVFSILIFPIHPSASESAPAQTTADTNDTGSNGAGNNDTTKNTGGSGTPTNDAGSDETPSNDTNPVVTPGSNQSMDAQSEDAFWAHAVITLESYSDKAHTIQNDMFDTNDEGTVYIYGSGFMPRKQYTITYYDGEGNKVVSYHGFKTDKNGSLSSFCRFGDFPRAKEGTWHTTVKMYNKQYTDTFYVAQAAIPELSSVLGAIGLSGFCGLTYYLFRRRRQYVPA